MPRFRTRSATVKPDTENLAGGEAFAQSPELELISMLLTSFVQDQYHRSAGDGLQRLGNLIASIPDKQFVAQAALYARNEFGMRSISHAVIGELVQSVRGEEWVKHAVAAAVRRPDDALEMLAYVGKPVPNALKKGLALAIQKFDEYSLAKYRGENTDCKMVDLFNLVHPVPRDAEQALLWNRLINGELKSRDTWEVNVSAAGSDAEAKKAAWTDLVESGKIGYFALLRNLRNILNHAPDVVPQAIELLKQESRIKKSLVLPFRYLTAYRQLENEPGVSQILEGLIDACEIALDNVPVFEGKTLTVVDTSGSMGATLSEKSVVRRTDVAFLLGAAFAKKQDGDFMIFASKAGYESVVGTAALKFAVDSIKLQGKYDHGTNFQAIFETAAKPYDRIVIFSDMQAWETRSSHRQGFYGYGIDSSIPSKALADYRQRHSVNSHIFSVDMAGYGSLQFPENRVYALAGFSEKIFDVMALFEQDREALINTIKGYSGEVS